MKTFFALLVLCTAPTLAFAQLDSNSVTVSASRIVNLQPDQAVFAVNVDTPMDVPLNDVVAALQSAGITLSNFAGVRTQGAILTPFPPAGPQNPPPAQVEWT